MTEVDVIFVQKGTGVILLEMKGISNHIIIPRVGEDLEFITLSGNIYAGKVTGVKYVYRDSAKVQIIVYTEIYKFLKEMKNEN